MTLINRPRAIIAYIKNFGKRNGFLRDVVALVSGTTLGQLITVLSLPLLTRIFTPESFGGLAIFASITGIGTVISSLRFEMAIVLPETREDASNLLIGSLVITGIVSTFIGLLLWPFWPWITKTLNSPNLIPYLWLIPISILFSGVFQAISYWCSREGLYNQLSFAKVINSIITAVSQLCFGLSGYTDSGGLILSVVIGTSASFLYLFHQLFIVDRSIWQFVHFSRIVAILYRYRKFPIYDNWAALLNSISWQLPSFFLSAFFSSSEAGYYSIGTRFLRLPMSLLGSSIGQVFFQRASKAEREGNLHSLVKSVYHVLVQIGLFPMLMLTIVGKEVFEVGLGRQWAEGGVYTQILSIWMFFWFISSPLSTIFRVLEKQEFSLLINILIFLTRFFSLFIGGYFGSIYLALGLFSITGIILYGLLSLAIVHASGVSYQFIFQTLLHEFGWFLPFGSILLFLKMVIHFPPQIIVIFSVTFLFIYYLIFLWQAQHTVLSNKDSNN